jgi:hypothetical protein
MFALALILHFPVLVRDVPIPKTIGPSDGSWRMWKRALAVLFVMMFLWRPNTAAAQDFEAGMQAYAAGDHVAAVGEWIPLAERGHVAAQTALVTLYYFTRDESLNSAELAFIWYRAAARAGHAEAKLGLARLHEKGRGVPRDLQVAANLVPPSGRERPGTSTVPHGADLQPRS